MRVPLSMVELSTVSPNRSETEALDESMRRAVELEALGYKRVWFAEHHLTPSHAGHSPELLIAAAAAMTSEIRVGSGAVLLNHYSPFKVAESFQQLNAMFPGRIDLGLGRSYGGPVADVALRRDRRSQPVDDHAQQVSEVVAWFHNAFPEDHPFATRPMMPSVAGAPDTWLLGSSPSSAHLAAQLGIGYAFATFINPAIAADMLQLYRREFRPTPFGTGAPRAMLAVNTTCAENDEAGRHLVYCVKGFIARLMRGVEDQGVPTPEVALTELTDQQRDEATWVTPDGRWPRFVAGGPESVVETLDRMVAESGADELMIQDLIADPHARFTSHRLVADAYGLVPRAELAGAH
ncbi:unannotated protein [freshwater metagenome]|jgi:luciferase family oxidoreductase group 1|uniref:Unannotated protein n=1 Tax=freshwater metagenome TaxID=449393 RepID=A0A6J7ID52_9ZZZZ|nr:MsnO8 family LLM class oxidoreductase [Actinomycetota bacterium]